MKKIILLIASSISLAACGNDDIANGMQYELSRSTVVRWNAELVDDINKSLIPIRANMQ